MSNSPRTALVAVAVMAALLTAVPAASGSPERGPSLPNQDWEAPIVVTDTGSATGARGLFDDDPNGLVPKTPFVQRYSQDTDHWEVWLCGGVSSDMGTVIANLEAATVSYYEAISGGIYRPSFTAGGSIPGDSNCLTGFQNDAYTAAGSPEGLLIVDNVTNGGYASPGLICVSSGTDCPTIGSTFPENGRYAVLGQNMVSDYPSVIVHEIGHTLQWPHSFSGLSGSDYDNPIDVMSGNSDRLGVRVTEEDPYLTLSYNRYQSGWVDPSDVLVADGGYQSTTLEPFNVDGTQLFAVETATTGQFYVMGARKLSTYDPIPSSWQGVEVYFVDHVCPQFSGAVCPGIFRNHHQEPPNAYQLAHVLTPGESIELEGVTVTVTGATATGYTIEADPDPGTSSPPAAPAAPIVSAADSEATISWSEPGSGGSAIVSYDLEVENRTAGGSTVTDVGLTLSTSVTALENGDVYRARVRAGNAIGDGNWSPWSGDFVPSAVPSPPGNPSATAGDSEIAVTWQAPASDGGAAIDGYELELEDETLQTTVIIAAGGTLSMTVTEVTNDHVYRVRVRAGNAAGTSEWSNWSSSVVPSHDAEPPPPPPPSPVDSFVDDDDSIFELDIEWLAAAAITAGCNPPRNDRFCPDSSVTRGQMAAFLVRALGLSATDGADFIDDDGSVFELDITKLAGSGITRGCNDAGTRFCPDDNVSRGQMAAFLVRALGLVDRGTADFVDDDESIFEADIEKLAAAGITSGCDEAGTRFCPDAPVTRAQMAAFLRRALS